MSAGELVVPRDMATPSEVELKASGVDPLKIGMFLAFISTFSCKKLLSEKMRQF